MKAMDVIHNIKTIFHVKIIKYKIHIYIYINMYVQTLEIGHILPMNPFKKSTKDIRIPLKNLYK